MEKAAATGVPAGLRWEVPPIAWAAIAWAACACCPTAWAEPDASAAAAGVQVAQAQITAPLGDSPVRVQMQTSTLPRLDAQDSGFQAPRVDLSVFPSNRTSGLAAVLGMGGIGPRPSYPLGLAPMHPSVDIGLRWSQRLAGQQRVDITAWRRMNTDEDPSTLAQMEQPVYGARVELDLSPVHKAGLAIDHGFIGVQLESGARISIKRKDGHPMIYYRASF